MKSESEIIDRLDYLKSTLSVIEQKQHEELKKPMFNRDFRLLMFLNREHNVHMYAISQLEWMLFE